MTISGIWPILPTPFLANGDIDKDAIRNLVLFALECRVDGLVFPGFASEVETLSSSERSMALHLLVEEVAGRIPIIAGASASTLDDVIELATEARQLGVRSIMIQPPKQLGADPSALVKFYSTISESIDDIEIILQNAPAPRGSDLDPEVILAIVDEVSSIRYIKQETLPSGPSISELLKSHSDRIGIIGGGGARYLIDEYTRGACATMPALELADVHVALDQAFRLGDFDTARDLYTQTLPLLVLQALYRVRLTKHVLMRRGVLDNSRVRATTPEFDNYVIRDIEDCLSLMTRTVNLELVSGSE